MLYYLLLVHLGCALKSTTPVQPTTETTDSVTVESDACPEGVKVGCNVPDVTQADIDTNQAKISSCKATCISNRQAESVSADMIESQCQQQCLEEHFMGQVEVVPTLEEPSE